MLSAATGASIGAVGLIPGKTSPDADLRSCSQLSKGDWQQQVRRPLGQRRRVPARAGDRRGVVRPGLYDAMESQAFNPGRLLA